VLVELAVLIRVVVGGGAGGVSVVVGAGGASVAVGASLSDISDRSPKRACRAFVCLLVGCLAVVCRRGGGRGGTSRKALSLRPLVADDRSIIVPTFGGLVRARAAVLLVAVIDDGRAAGGTVTGRSCGCSVMTALGRPGASRSRLHSFSNSSSVAASTGLLLSASILSAVAFRNFCVASSWRA